MKKLATLTTAILFTSTVLFSQDYSVIKENTSKLSTLLKSKGNIGSEVGELMQMRPLVNVITSEFEKLYSIHGEKTLEKIKEAFSPDCDLICALLYALCAAGCNDHPIPICTQQCQNQNAACIVGCNGIPPLNNQKK